jgi:outer membrane protein assembly factor BamB
VIVGELAITVGSEAVYGIELATGEDRVIAERAGGPLSAPAVAEIGSTLAVLFLEGPREGSEPAQSVSGSASVSPSASPTGSPSAGGEIVTPNEADEPTSHFVAVSLEDGTALWPQVRLPATSRSGVRGAATTAYVGDQDGHVLAVDLVEGSITWTAEVAGRVDVPVAVSGGTVYAIARDPDASNVAIIAIDAASGEELWKVFPQATSTVGSAPAAGRDSSWWAPPIA